MTANLRLVRAGEGKRIADLLTREQLERRAQNLEGQGEALIEVFESVADKVRALALTRPRGTARARAELTEAVCEALKVLAAAQTTLLTKALSAAKGRRGRRSSE